MFSQLPNTSSGSCAANHIVDQLPSRATVAAASASNSAAYAKIVQTIFTMCRVTLLLLLVCFGLAVNGCGTRQVAPVNASEIVSVAQWGGTPAEPSAARRHRIDRITLHHQGLAFPRGKDPQKYLRDLQSWSRNTRGWIDVPYHYVIDLDGNTYEGRDINFAGDTNTNYDPAGHALIEVVGNFEDVEPNAAQLEAISNLMALLATRYDVSVDNIRGHRDVATGTECPGKNLYRYLENGYFHAQVRDRMKSRDESGGRK